MTDDEKLPPSEEMQDPDTDTGSEEEELEIPKAIPVAEPSVSEPEPEPAAPMAGPPRVDPKYYTFFLASTLMLAGTLTVWERSSITGSPDLYGFQSIGGGFVFALSGYCVLTGIVSLIRGGLRFGIPLLTGFLAAYFAILDIVAQTKLEGFKYLGNFTEEMGALEGFKGFLRQLGPGIYLCLFGGLLILWLFIKALFFGSKKPEEAAPRRRRR